MLPSKCFTFLGPLTCSDSVGCGGLGTAEPAEEAPNKDEPVYARPSSGRYAPSMANFGNNNSNTPSGYTGYPTSQPESVPYNNYAPSQHYYQQQSYQNQTPYNSGSQGSYNYGSNSFSNPAYANNNSGGGGFQAGRPTSSTASSRSSTRSSSSSSSWGSQPPLTSSKRDQNWEKKRRLWLARKNSSNGSIYGDRPPTSSSTWSIGPTGGAFDDSINPPSPLSKLMHQHAQQQQQPPTPGIDYQRLGTASSTRSSSSYMSQSFAQQPYPAQSQMPGTGYPAGASFSRAGLSTASSTAASTTSSRRQPPGGQCQWSLG
ncbi:unnamed protein product [Phytophthora lilii]|uniref:Unnamed protein product n=1 Tax=Phytophthora lilii TaxID=2077276 RepID=A0A9W6WID0_9STRA|nr:unnamed protein product [Phytophthora lilii]